MDDQWSSSYKLHFGAHAVQPQKEGAGSSSINSATAAKQETFSTGASRPASASTTAGKLRTAIDLSHTITSTNNGEDDQGSMKVETEGAAGGLDTEGKAAAAVKAAALVDEEDMDGKRITGTPAAREGPEVSMQGTLSTTTYNQSGSLTFHGGQSSYADGRNGSIESIDERHMSLGLHTIPNQFCTKADAMELKKLLLLSGGTRGGIVPSSSAVMDMYMVGKVVGVGSYGKVRVAWHRLTESKVAIKTYDKSKLKDPAHWKRVHSEIKIMEQISHPWIARMYEAVETPKRMHLIMEVMDGGNLCSHVKAKRRLGEEESKKIFFQILQAMEYLHSLGVSHRDVKLENVLFVDNKERDIKLIDFGFSTLCQPGKKLKVFCGTPSYMAPEIVRRSEYEGKPVDMWSMGIVLYALLCGCFPFRAKAYPDLYRRIARGTFTIPEELSAPVTDLLRQLLTVDANHRITASAALRHPWLQTPLMQSPNIAKLRKETVIMISEKASDDLDEEVIKELESFGMNREEVIRVVLTKTHSSLATLYYLLLDMIVGKRPKNQKVPVATASKQAANGAGFAARVKQQVHQANTAEIATNSTGTGAGSAQANDANKASGAPSSNNNTVHAHSYQWQQGDNNAPQGSHHDYRYLARPRSASATGSRPLASYIGRR